MKKLKFEIYIDFFSKIFMKNSKKDEEKEEEEKEEENEIILFSYPLFKETKK
jgi:hypothetical protein